MLARTTDTTVHEGKLFVAPISKLKRVAIDWQPISTAADKITDARLGGDTLYLKSHAGAPRSRVLALSLKTPELAKAKVVVPEPRVGVLADFALGPDGLIYTEVLAGFNTRGTPARTRQGWPRRGYRAKGARLDAPDRRSRPRLPRRAAQYQRLDGAAAGDQSQTRRRRTGHQPAQQQASTRCTRRRSPRSGSGEPRWRQGAARDPLSQGHSSLMAATRRC